MNTNRQPFTKRAIRLVGEQQRDTLLSLVRNLPTDDKKPLLITIEEEEPKRKPDQNSLMWVGPLKDMEQQAFIEGRQYKSTVWHEFFKKEFLPEEFEEKICKKGYQKWDYTPVGDRVLTGSTTELTVKGFAIYMEQIYAFGANLGVQFKVSPNESKS